MSRTSLLIVLTGDGKGKSSSAFGMMARGWARGWSVAVVQFLKSPEWKTGEQKLAEHLNIPWHTMGDGFTWESTDLDASGECCRQAWTRATDLLHAEAYDLLILDELTYGITYGWLDEDDVLSALRGRPARTNVVVTGRDASAGLCDLANTVTEMRNIKHAFDAGITARRGLDY